MKIRRVEADLFLRTDGRKDMTKLIVAFRNYANAPTKADIQTSSNRYWNSLW
jgi:hypothetical protein